MKVTLGPETFRLYPFRTHQLFFLVYICPDEQNVRTAVRDATRWAHPHLVATCIGEGTPRRTGIIGALFLPRTRLGVGLVAHELAHAAFRACEARQWRVVHWAERRLTSAQRQRGIEERYAGIVERLNGQFWREAYARGFATPG